MGGLVGAVQVYAGLTLVNKVGAGPFVGITVTAALIASLVIDHFGLFHMPVHAINIWRIGGAFLMAGGIGLIAKVLTSVAGASAITFSPPSPFC